MSFLKWYTTSRGTNQTRIIEVWWKSQKPNKNMSRKKDELVVDFNIEIMWFISHINFFHVYHPHTFKYFSHKFRERWKKNISKINVKGDPSIHFAMIFFSSLHANDRCQTLRLIINACYLIWLNLFECLFCWVTESV